MLDLETKLKDLEQRVDSEWTNHHKQSDSRWYHIEKEIEKKFDKMMEKFDSLSERLTNFIISYTENKVRCTQHDKDIENIKTVFSSELKGFREDIKWLRKVLVGGILIGGLMVGVGILVQLLSK